MTAEPNSRQTVRFAAALEAGLACFTGPAGVRGGGQQAVADRKRPLLTAFSGGPDSTALVLLAEQYARQRGISHQAVLIDHGLRLDSADEASRVATRMRHFGIDIAIRRVVAVAPTGGIQSWARDQRYAIPNIDCTRNRCRSVACASRGRSGGNCFHASVARLRPWRSWWHKVNPVLGRYSGSATIIGMETR